MMKQNISAGYCIVLYLLAASIFLCENTIAQDRVDNVFSSVRENNVSKAKTRIMIVSSYHREYLWTRGTAEGVSAALLEFGYLDNREQVDILKQDDFVESSRAVIQKLWMDSKRKSSKKEIAEALSFITGKIDGFQPDLLLLGDDNAANYIGNYYLDTAIPIVFWGINGLPLKYGIIDSLDRPGHNITGVYQQGYHVQSFTYLQKLFPYIKNIAILSDDSPTGRAHSKRLERYEAEGTLSVKIIEIVVTNSFEEWQARALDLEDKVDAFYISTHSTLKDKNGNNVDYLKVGSWYLKNIQKIATTPTEFFVEEGFFSAVDDSAFKQGYEAAKIGHEILAKGLNPAEIVSFFPSQGPFIVNRQRAKKLGLEEIINNNEKIIDKFIDRMIALETYP